jgi:hypothetical protein
MEVAMTSLLLQHLTMTTKMFWPNHHPIRNWKFNKMNQWNAALQGCHHWHLEHGHSTVTTVHMSSVNVDGIHECWAEIDSHKDTMVLGNDAALIFHDFDHPVCVHGYDQSVAQQEHCKSVSGIFAYDHFDRTT